MPAKNMLHVKQGRKFQNVNNNMYDVCTKCVVTSSKLSIQKKRLTIKNMFYYMLDGEITSPLTLVVFVSGYCQFAFAAEAN